ncbi:MAG: hypothetical protein GY705_06020 [Bacteroidetes bacterium]|nr:hypothetical protein [Bacteroidota bacterium]
MKKASMIVLESVRESSLEKLRKIGVVHLEEKAVSNEELDLLKDWQSIMERSLFLLPPPGKKDEPNEIDKEADPLEKAIKILELSEQTKTEREEITKFDPSCPKSDTFEIAPLRLERLNRYQYMY